MSDSPESFLEDLSGTLAYERTRGHARMLSMGMPALQIDALMSLAQQMHAEQLQCIARTLGLADAVVVH